MMRMTRFLRPGASLLVLGAIWFGGMAASTHAAPTVTNVRLSHDADTTRLVLDLSEPVPFSIYVVGDPYRLVIDLPATEWRLPSGAGRQRRGLVTGLRYDRLESATRVVVGLAGPIQVSAAFPLPPNNTAGHRLVVDLRAVEAGRFVADRLPPLTPTRAARVLAPAPPAAPTVTDVRLSHDAGTTRVVLDLTAPVQFSINIVRDPYRLIIDLPAAEWRLPSGAERQYRGLVTGFRYGRFQSAARIVMGLTGPVQVAAAFPLTPGGGAGHRVVVDLRPVDVRLSAPDPLPQPRQTRAVEPVARPAPPPPPRGKFVVVLDAGHGGADPGAIGVAGVREKDVNLAASRELQQALEATGKYRVVLTRSTDTFIPLRTRVQMAREAGAELFISIHADSHRNPGIHGASVYTLSEAASDREAAALVQRENRADAIGGVDLLRETTDVAAILVNLGQRESMNLSASLAELLVPEIAEDWNTVQNPHRFGGFVVLTAPDVPSVLVELGYLSNRREERVLSTKSGRRPLVSAIARAVDRYFGAHAG